MSLDLKITSDMVLAAVSKAALENMLDKCVAATLSNQITEYFMVDRYGSTEFQQSCREFIRAIVVQILEERRDVIRAACEKHVDEMLSKTTDIFADAFVERMRKAIT